MRFLFLHLSDFHFGDSNAYNDFHISKIADATNLFSSYQHVLIIISGDIAYSGGKNQYSAANAFVDKLTDCLKERRPGLESFHVLCVPGNHDLDLSAGQLSSQKLQDIRKVASYEKHKDNELGKLKSFMEFANGYCCFMDDKIHSQIILSFDGYSVEVNLVNSAIYSTLEEDKGLHYLPSHCIDALGTPTGAELAITVEYLMMLFRRGNSNAFIALADKLNNDKSANVFLLSLRRVVSKALVFMPGLDYKQQQQLASKFFPDNYPKRLIVQRKASGYTENE